MAGSSGFAITISAKDQASGTLDSLNKRLARLSAPADRFNKSLSKFSDVSGLSRVTQGVRGLGASAADAFRSLDHMASPLAAITSVGSIAGMAALTRQWAQFGNQVGQTSYRLNMPVGQLGTLRGAMRLAGGSAADLDTGLRGLDEKLRGAAFGRDPAAVQAFQSLHIGFGDAVHGARKAGDALGDIAESMVGKTPGAQHRILESLGLGDSFLPLLKNGRQGLEDFEKTAQQTGGVMTAEMAANATKMNTAWQRLGMDVEGVGNRIVDSWSGTITKVLDSSSKWIENNKKTADSITEIGSAVGVLAALKPAAWVLRLLGLGAAVDAAPAALPLALKGDTAPDYGKMNKLPGGVVGNDPFLRWWDKTMPSWLGGGGSSAASSGTSDGPALPNHLLDNLSNSKLGKLLARGEAGSADYNAVNRGAAGGYASGMENLVNMTVAQVQAAQKDHRFNAAGRYQVIGPTLDKAVANLGLTGQEKFDKATQDRIFEQYLIGSKRPEIGDYITGKSNDRHAALLGMAKEWASVADPDTGKSFYGGVANNKASISVADAGSALDDARGHVHVTVELKGAPAGTTARTTTSGPVTSPPPRIETPMPMVN